MGVICVTTKWNDLVLLGLICKSPTMYIISAVIFFLHCTLGNTRYKWVDVFLWVSWREMILPSFVCHIGTLASNLHQWNAVLQRSIHGGITYNSTKAYLCCLACGMVACPSPATLLYEHIPSTADHSLTTTPRRSATAKNFRLSFDAIDH
jgi:hypothetical protein